MSNSYTHIAFNFDAGTTRNAEKIRRWFRREDFYADVEQHQDVLLFTSEHADVDLLVKMLQHAMCVMPKIRSPQGFEWSFSADKYRVGEFGGGAAVLRREPGWLRSVDTAEWLKEELSRG